MRAPTGVKIYKSELRSCCRNDLLQMGGFRGNRGFGFQQQLHGGFNRSNQLSGLNGMGMARPNPKGEKLKFDGDFDFEKANQKFKEEIIVKMEEMKVGR